MSTVADGKVVSIHYTLTDPQGQVLDSSNGREPLAYLHGHGNIVPGLERQLAGHAVDDRITAVVAPADGYGERHENVAQQVPRTAFPPDATLEVGVQFMARTHSGESLPLWITSVADDHVVVDPNHPLAGVTLSFEVQVVAIRDATTEEEAHGHVHGAGGHAH